MAVVESPTEGRGGSIASSSWWSPERMRRAGFAGIVGGVLLTAVAVYFNATGQADLDLETSRGAFIGLAHSVTYVLMLAALFGANYRYGVRYGRLGRVSAYTLGVGLAALIPTFPLMSFAFGGEWVPGEVVAGLGFIAIHLAATVFGLALWRRTTVNRLASALFITVVPAIIIVTALTGFDIVNLTPAAFEAPLYLGFAALGYDLLNHDPTAQTRGLS